MTYSVHDDDDLLDDGEDESEEQFLDGVGHTITSQVHTPPPAPQASYASSNAPPARLARIKPMTATMMQRHPRCVSILITRDDGMQILFARPR